MNVTFNIENDEQLRKHIKDAIDGQIRAIVRSEVSKTVVEEVARVLPALVNQWSFDTKINGLLDQSVRQIVSNHAKQLGLNNAFISEKINEKLDAALSGNDWKNIVDEIAKEKIKALIS